MRSQYCNQEDFMARYSNPMSDDKGYLDEQQVRKLLEAAKMAGQRDFVLLNTLLHTGRRISEIVKGTNGYGIKPSDIDFKARNITYNILKKNPRTSEQIGSGEPKRIPERKTLPANSYIIALLQDYIQTNVPHDDYIFPITKQRADQIIKKLGGISGVEYVGSKPIHCHHFRHTFAVNITQSGDGKPEDIVQLKNLLQHSDINMTMTYLRYGNTRARELMERLAPKGE
jgi:integrase